MKRIFAGLLAALLCLSIAAAEGVELTAEVTATQTLTLSAPAAGKVERCPVMAGDHVEAGDELMALQTQKVYAAQDGTVRIFGQPGDSADALVTRYGGVCYLEPIPRFTIAGSTKNAYDNDDAKLVHPGEKVYLRSSSNAKLTGTGVVTAVSGASFTVEVDGAPLESGTTAYIYRAEDFAYSSRIGSGKVSQVTAAAVTGTGYLVRWHVEDGQQVRTGDLLFETLEGDFAPGETDQDVITAPQAGVIAAVNTNAGRTVAAQDALLDFYPDDGLRVVASAPQADLADIVPGMTVQILLDAGDAEQILEGTVEKISLLAQEESEYESTYAVYVLPQDPQALRFGMSVTVRLP